MLSLITCSCYDMTYHLPPDILILDLWLESCACYPVLYIQWPESIVYMYSWIPDHVLTLLFLWIANCILNYYKTTCTRFGGNWWALNNHVYGGLIESRVATYLRDHLAATRDSVGYAGTPTPDYSCRVCTRPRPISMGSAILYSCSGVNKSRYLAVRSGSASDTPEPLSRACTGPSETWFIELYQFPNNLLYKL